MGHGEVPEGRNTIPRESGDRPGSLLNHLGVGEDARKGFQMLRLATGVLAGVFISLCHAQDDAVVITATRFPDTKRDLPVGVTVITADDIRKSASSNLGDILAQFGLLQTRDLAGTLNQSLDLRGFGITGDQNTLVLLDGVRISENEIEPASLSSIPLESIERIEIVRGSGGVLYGGGATGGTINIITRQGAPGERRAVALARFGDFGTQELRGSVHRYGETLGGGISASHEDTDGYRRNSAYRQRSLAARLDARTQAARAYARVVVDDLTQRLPGSLSEAQIAQDRRQTTTPDDFREREGAHLTVGGARTFGKHEAQVDAGYRTKRSHSFINFAGFGAFITDAEVEQWTLTPRAKVVFGRHDLVAGLDFETWDYDRPSSAAGVQNPRLASQQSNAALFGQASLWLTGSTRAVLGARRQRMAQELFVEGDAPRTSSHRLEAYEAALRQGFGGGWSAYGKLGKSFRVATFDENACFVPPCAGELLRPQKGKSGELGVEVERGRLRARTSVYQMDLEDEIHFIPLTFTNINLSPTRRRGIEAEAAWRATDRLDLRLGLAWLEATFRSGTYGGVDVSGNRVPLVPEVLVTAGASWRFLPRTRMNLNARYVGEQRFDDDQANRFARKQPAYGLIDMKLEHALARRWEIALEVRNLFDKDYFSYGRVNSPTAPTTFSALPSPGRAAYASLAWRLD
jgi:iron complex outermembrane recepter protein